MTRFDEDAFKRLVRGETRGPVPGVARAGLAAASLVYGVGVRVRNLAFDRGWKPAFRAGVPVVSVGNLTVGGTGKTPMVEWVARWYRRHGLRVAVLSRGYGRDPSAGLNDEAMVLEENLPDVPHLLDPDRVASARIAVGELESQLLVLDDGFQHRRLARDLDLVLLDALEPFGLGRLLPRGLLREPVGSLRRAGLVVLTRADQIDGESLRATRAEAERRAGALRWVVTRHAPIAVTGHGIGDEPVESLSGRAVAAFCGIGNPLGFRRTVEPLVGKLVDLRVFPDHHLYTARDVSDLIAWVHSTRADLALTTQKDLVKLRAPDLGGVALRALRIGLDVLDGGDLLDSALGGLVPAC